MFANGFESAIDPRRVDDSPEPAVKCTAQEQDRRVGLAEQSVSAGAVVQDQAVRRRQLDDAPDRGVRLLLSSEPRIALRQPAE